MSKNQKLLLIAFLLIIFALIKLVALRWWQQQQPTAQAVACDITQGCDLPNGAQIQFTGQLGLKTTFHIQLKNAPAHAQKISVSFSMRDMDMGFNRYDLRPQGNGVWQETQVKLPLCTESRHDFFADINIDGKVYSVPFSAY